MNLENMGVKMLQACKKIGGSTEAKVGEKKDRVIDALNATKAAKKSLLLSFKIYSLICFQNLCFQLLDLREVMMHMRSKGGVPCRLPNSEAAIRQREVALKTAQQTKDGRDVEVSNLRAELENVKDETLGAMEQLKESESEAKALRTMTQRMVLTHEDMVGLTFPYVSWSSPHWADGSLSAAMERRTSEVETYATSAIKDDDIEEAVALKEEAEASEAECQTEQHAPMNPIPESSVKEESDPFGLDALIPNAQKKDDKKEAMEISGKLWASVREQQHFFLVQPFALQTISLLGGNATSPNSASFGPVGISPRVTNDGTNQGERATGTPNVLAAAGGVNSQTDGDNLITRGVDDESTQG
ncbi:coiled-coil domain-containing protein SCD2 isoform X1 [Tanacetum coccineum]|uniref:Coiled-coil domain-containing protein SCD2 isoform X1 n=1 Tax=Tanacetum coccineum TaxID=301880 RepID=A0ABQ4Y3B2_9ASTR